MRDIGEHTRRVLNSNHLSKIQRNLALYIKYLC